MNNISQYFLVLGLALLPAAGNFAGAVLAEMIVVTDRARNYSLHAAAGIVLGVVGIELMPRALQAATPWKIVLAYLLGGLTYMLVEFLLEKRVNGSDGDSSNDPPPQHRTQG